MDVFGLTNQKGGVGKTTHTVNLGAALAEQGRKVLMVDMDPQGHLSEALQVPETPDERSLRGWLLGEWRDDPREMIAVYRDNMHVLPTNVDMFLLDKGLYQANNRERRVARLLERFEGDYDAVLLDCPPSLGATTDCCLYAMRERPDRRSGALVPIEPEKSSVRALRLLLRQIALLSLEMDMTVNVLGLIPSRFSTGDGNTVVQTLDAFRGLGEPPVIAEIRRRSDIRDAWASGLSVLEYAPRSESAGWYRELAKVVYA